MYKDKIHKYIEKNKENMIKTLAEIVKIRSVRGEAKENMPYGEEPYKALETFLSIANDMGFKTENIDGYAGNIDFNEKEAKLGILCHLDVVPEGTGWTSEPYELKVTEEKLIGRGTIDDKGPAVAVLYAMKCIKDLCVPIKSGVRFIVGTDEEMGSSDLEYYEKKYKYPEMVFTPDGEYPIINTEKGMIRAHFRSKVSCEFIEEIYGSSAVNAVPGEAYALLNGVTEEDFKDCNKEIIKKLRFEEKEGKLKVTAHGKGVHASIPEKGDNATAILINALSSVKKLNNVAEGFCTMFPYRETDGTNAGVRAEDKESGALTLAFTCISVEGGKLCGIIDIRFPVCENVKSVIEKLKVSAEIHNLELTEYSGSEPHHVREDSEFVKKLLKVYSEQTGFLAYCKAIGGGTYVHHNDSGVAFGAEFPGEDNNMHGADEFIKINSLIKNAEIFANAIMEICG